MMHAVRRSGAAAVAIILGVLIAPSVAIACSIAAPSMNAKPVPRSEVVVPIRHEGARAAWGMRGSWRSIQPSLASRVRVGGGSRDGTWGLARRSQRVLHFHALHRHAARRWYDDTDPATTCSRRGEPVYTRPRLVVRQTERAVFATVVTRRQPDPIGCVSWAPGDAPLPGNQSVVAEHSCADTAFGKVVLKRPVGDRRIVLDRFGPTDVDATS